MWLNESFPKRRGGGPGLDVVIVVAIVLLVVGLGLMVWRGW